jgi:hypothetical protein
MQFHELQHRLHWGFDVRQPDIAVLPRLFEPFQRGQQCAQARRVDKIDAVKVHH